MGMQEPHRSETWWKEKGSRRCRCTRHLGRGGGDERKRQEEDGGTGACGWPVGQQGGRRTVMDAYLAENPWCFLMMSLTFLRGNWRYRSMIVSRWVAHSFGDGPCSLRDSDFRSGLALRWSQGEGVCGCGDGERPIGPDMPTTGVAEVGAAAARFSGHKTPAGVPPLASRDGNLDTGESGIQSVDGKPWRRSARAMGCK